MTLPIATFDAPAPIDVQAKELRWWITDGILNQPRSLQARIGPSELGEPCDHCLAAKLAGWEKNATAAWLPFIGTGVHAELAAIFEGANHKCGWRRYEVEQRVTVGIVRNEEITGSCDLFDRATGTVIDWKIVGKNTLDQVRRNGPSPTYRTQAHLYGQGWVNAGHTVTAVMICFLPRNSPTLEQGIFWGEDHDPAIAAAALERANHIATQLDTLATISTSARDQWITNQPRVEGCYSCARYPDRPTPDAATYFAASA